MTFKKFFLLIISIILGLIVFVFVFQRIGLENVIRVFVDFSWWHFLTLLFSVGLILFIFIKKWKIIARPFNYKTKWRRLFVAFLGCQTISFITPVMYLGGEGFKALLLKENDQEKSFLKTFSLIVIDRLAEGCALLIFFLLGGIALFFYGFFLVGLIMTFLSLLILVAIFLGIKATSFFIFIIKILGFGKILKDKEKAKEEINTIEKFLINHKKLFIYDIVFSFVALVLSSLQIYLITLFLGKEINLLEVYFIKVATMIAGVFPTPGSIGGFEGAVALSFSLLALPVQIGLALVLVVRGLQFVEVGLGTILIFPYLTKTIFPKFFQNKNKS
ncbi:MAG: flippase-like domain-containing protein [Bacteroidetes bacterium]|nr:flippase-like domain-containing protein [Bacteroidota bacterium]